MSTENKLTKTIMESTVLISLASGVGWISRKMLKESMINDPSSNIMNFGKWIIILSVSIYLRDFLLEKKILPT